MFINYFTIKSKAASSKRPQNEHGPSMSDYLEMEELTFSESF